MRAFRIQVQWEQAARILLFLMSHCLSANRCTLLKSAVSSIPIAKSNRLPKFENVSKAVNLYCYCMTSRSTLTPLLLLFKLQTLTLVCRLRKRGMESNNIRIEATWHKSTDFYPFWLKVGTFCIFWHCCSNKILTNVILARHHYKD